MTLFKIILITVEVDFVTFDYKIYFKQKYDLINGFEVDYKASRKAISYAKKVGLVELIFGIILILIDICVVVIRQ